MTRYVDVDFMGAMDENWREGADRPGRSPNDWKDIPWDEEQEQIYTHKLLRHFAQSRNLEMSTKQRRKHLAAVACNANILWYHSHDES